MSKIKSLILVALLAVCLFPSVAQTEGKKKKNLLSGVKSNNVVKVGKNIITQAELDKTYNEMKSMEAVYGKELSKKEILEMMIDDYLLKDRVKEETLILDENQFNQELNMMKYQYAQMKTQADSNYKYSDEDFKRYVETDGKMTYAAFEDKIKQKVLGQQFITKMATPKLQALDRKTFESSKDFPVEIPGANGVLSKYNSLREIYEENEQSFLVPTQIVLKHIYFRTIDAEGAQMKADDKAAVKERAKDCHARLKKGEEFDKLCLIYSDDGATKEEYTDPASKETHRGYIGPFPLSGQYAKITREKYGDTIFEAFNQLKAGQFSDICESQYGFHIFYAIEKKEKTILSFEESKSTIVQQLKNYEMQKINQETYLELMKDLRKKAEIKYYMKEYENSEE